MMKLANAFLCDVIACANSNCRAPPCSLKTAFFAVGCLMTISSVLQISLISEREWSSLFSRLEILQHQFTGTAQSMAFTFGDASSFNALRRMSDVSDLSIGGDIYSQPEMTLWDALHSNIKED